jgi:argininosuccinate lyase
VGRLVRDAERDGLALAAVPAGRAAAIHPALPRVLGALGGWEDSVERRGTEGGSARAAVTHQLESLARAFAAPWAAARPARD